MKVCSGCKEALSEENFHNKTKSKDGLFPYCKPCSLLQKRAWVENNYNRYLLATARYRATVTGLEFNIEAEDIVVPEICPYLGIVMVRDQGRGRNMDSPSLDRIDNSKGYIKGNVEVISKQANYMKNMATQEQLITFAKSILHKAGYPQIG